ncbi:SHY1 [Candida pseudojiufengensis]|uniref:SHY1 n=1 Tax=Candida pseudojiufengensis TaxID=497109 RepID=UPI002225661D|nr:SHY1 [Candida pseudojiufengensis]KAI5963742.1 SHY1 [Candida pseudojiufengensis]
MFGVRKMLLVKPTPNLLRFTRSVKTSTIDWKPIKSVPGNLRTISHQKKMPIIRKFILGLMYAMPIITFGLGCWQIKRLKWKNDLITKCETNLASPVLESLPANLDPNVIEEFEYRRFKCKGKFDYDQEMFLGPRLKDGVLGYLIVTPFIRSDGGKPILVERGWIHKDKVIPSKRTKGYLSHLAMPQGEIEIEALFRCMPKKSSLQFDHEPGAKLFNIPDIPAMAIQSGSLPIYCQMIYDLSDHLDYKTEKALESKGQNTSPSFWNKIFFKADQQNNNEKDKKYIQDLSDDSMYYQEFEFINQGVPIAAKPTIKFSNNHLQYLITWFGVCIASTGLLIYMSWKTKQFSSAERIIEAKRKDMKKLI